MHQRASAPAVMYCINSHVSKLLPGPQSGAFQACFVAVSMAHCSHHFSVFAVPRYCCSASTWTIEPLFACRIPYTSTQVSGAGCFSDLLPRPKSSEITSPKLLSHQTAIACDISYRYLVPNGLPYGNLDKIIFRVALQGGLPGIEANC